MISLANGLSVHRSAVPRPSSRHRHGRPGRVPAASRSSIPGRRARCRRSGRRSSVAASRSPMSTSAAAHAHSSRSRGRVRHARAREPAPARLRPRERRAAHDRSRQAARERRPAVRRRDGHAVGRIPAGACRTGWSSCGEGSASSPAARHLDVAYTPGHASHHVSYFSRDSRHRVRRRHGGHSRDARRLRPAADAAARHRSRSVAGEPRANRRMARRHALHHAFRTVHSHGAAHLSEFASRLEEDAQLVKRLARERRAPTSSAKRGSSRKCAASCAGI